MDKKLLSNIESFALGHKEGHKFLLTQIEKAFEAGREGLNGLIPADLLLTYPLFEDYLNSPKIILAGFSAASGRDEGYWQARCEAAEDVLDSFGINKWFAFKNTDGIKNLADEIKIWQELQKQLPSQDAGGKTDGQEENKRLKDFAEQFLRNPYPTKTFPVLTDDELYDIRQLLKDQLNISLDRLSAEMGRQILKEFSQQAKEILSAH